VVVASVEQVTFGEFVMALSEPCAAYVIDLGEKVGSQAAVDVGTSLAQHLVDKLFGGPGEAFGTSRALTDLEQMVLKTIIERVMNYYQEAWGDYLPLQPTTVGFEGMPGTLQVASRDDNVLIANFEIKTGPETGMLTICVPLIALESFLQEKSGKTVGGQRSRIEDREATRRQVERTLRQVGVSMTARLAQFGLAGSEVSALRPGRVLLTPHHAEAEVELQINGQPRFECRIGQHRGHYGLRISQPTDGAVTARHSKGRLLP
jgi:flagellar motor switch protein FliM